MYGLCPLLLPSSPWTGLGLVFVQVWSLLFPQMLTLALAPERVTLGLLSFSL